MEMVLGTGTKANANFSQVYDDFVLIRHPMTVEDVCNMVLTSGVSMNVVDKQNNLVYKFDFGHKMPQLSLAIDTSKMHANVVKLLTITEVDNSGNGGIIEHMPGEDVDTTMHLLQDVRDCLAGTARSSMVLSQADVNTIMASKRLDKTKRMVVLMRQSSPLLLLNTKNFIGFCTSIDTRLRPWNLYGLLTNKGYVVAMCVKVSGKSSSVLYHALSESVKVSAAIPLHKLKDLKPTTKISEAIISDVTAINQTTKKDVS
jgi:hypothetical protein